MEVKQEYWLCSILEGVPENIRTLVQLNVMQPFRTLLITLCFVQYDILKYLL